MRKFKQRRQVGNVPAPGETVQLINNVKKDIVHFIQIIKTVISGPVPTAAASYDETVLESDYRTRMFGYSILIIVFGGFGFWATFAPIESAARGQGIVQVEGNRKPLQHYEGGIVSQILVSNGDYVSAGQPLIQLDPTQARAEQRIIEGRVWAKRALLDRLISERDDSGTIEFQSWLLAAEDEGAQIAIASERSLFEVRRANRLGEISVLEQQISQLTSQIEGALAVVASKQKVADSLQTEGDELEELLQEGYVDKQRIRELDRALAQTLGELADLKSQVTSAQVAIEEAQLKILNLNTRFKTQVVDELSDVQVELFDMQQRLLAINDRVSRMSIDSPASGYVLGLRPNVVGAVITPGEELLAMVPDVEKLIVDVQMSPMDIDRIRVGQQAEVRFAVFKDAYTITGSLVKVSADSMVDEKTGDRYFEAKVELMEEDLALLGDNKLVPGMPADVLVKTGNRTLLGYLTSPLQRMFENSLIED